MTISTDQAIVNGVISCNGASPIASLAGGGAGGSIYIAAQALQGSGKITADGGNGGTSLDTSKGAGGGGGGGRIALELDDISAFSGILSSKGGNGYQKGSAGTVYVHNTVLPVDGGHLIVSNTISNSQIGENEAKETFTTILPTILSEETLQNGPLSLITISAEAKVLLHSGEVFTVTSVIDGDGTGSLVVSNSTSLQADSSSLILKNVTVIIVDGSLNSDNLQLISSKLILTPLGTSRVSSDPLTLSFSPSFVPSVAPTVEPTIVNNPSSSPSGAPSTFPSGIPTQSPVDLNSPTYAPSEEPSSSPSYSPRMGSYYYITVELTEASELEVSYNLYFNISSYADQPVSVRVSNSLTVDSTSSVHSNGQGYVGAYDDSSAVSSEFGRYGTMGGGGGGYGGDGGDGFDGDGGVGGYGDMTYPVSLGSGGGGSYHWKEGGNGGGAMILTVGMLHLNGQISVDGTEGADAGAGGGSGGSLILNCKYIDGSGRITSNGGSALYSDNAFAGGGSGGKHCLS
jgi:hypothetical protein